MLAFMRLVQSDDDLISFNRTINMPKRGMGPAALEKLRQFAFENRLPILLAAADPRVPLSAKQKEELKNFTAAIFFLRAALKEGMTLGLLVENILERFHYREYLKEELETKEDREENISQLIAKAEEFEPSEGRPFLQSFLEELSLMTSMEEDKSQSSIKLMTLHNSKGLEFNAVFMAGMDEGLFPHSGYLAQPAELEEERRLCYVGMTRAKKEE